MCKRLLLVGIASVLSFSALAQGPIITSVGTRGISPAAKSQPCDADSCSDQRTVVTVLPEGAEYLGPSSVHFFTTAGGADTPEPHEVPLNTDIGWSHFGNFQVAKDDHGRWVISATYYNRSTRNRIINITADYKMNK